MEEALGAGTEVPIVWRGRRVRAFVPTPLARRDLSLDAPTAARTATAAAEIAHAAEAMQLDFEPLVRLLLRSEGVASSYVEGISAPVVDIVLAEELLGYPDAGAAAWVTSNLAAVAHAVAGADGEGMLSTELLCEWHRILMAGSPTPAHSVGALRSDQGWIGGTSPLDAHLVTPPPDAVPSLVSDLVAYANRSDVDPVALAALVHAQFEVIHPFADGNGRVGRVLTAWVLTRRLSLLVPPPVSVAVAADVGGYTAGLTLFRLGDHRRWIRWFADAVTDGGRAQRDLVAAVERITQAWRTRLDTAGPRPRRDAAVFATLDLLPRHLVLTSSVVTAELGVSRKTAVSALGRLAQAGILTEYGTVRPRGAGRPAALYVSTELLGLTGSSPLR